MPKLFLLAGITIMAASLPATASSIEIIDPSVTGARGANPSVTVVASAGGACIGSLCAPMSIPRAGAVPMQPMVVDTTFTAAAATQATADTGRAINLEFARKFPDPAAPGSAAPMAPSDTAFADMAAEFDADGNPITPEGIGNIPPQGVETSAEGDVSATESAMPDANPAIAEGAAPTFEQMELRTGG